MFEHPAIFAHYSYGVASQVLLLWMFAERSQPSPRATRRVRYYRLFALIGSGVANGVPNIAARQSFVDAIASGIQHDDGAQQIVAANSPCASRFGHHLACGPVRLCCGCGHFIGLWLDSIVRCFVFFASGIGQHMESL